MHNNLKIIKDNLVLQNFINFIKALLINIML
nr:MAG TPA: hypothetical protein [Caudoviricetes sp.]